MKKRLLYYNLEKYIDSKEALIITGMRQVGKTTIMRQLFEKIDDKPKLWFDFDNPLDQKIFEDLDYNNILHRLVNMAGVDEKKRLYIFIDEVQNFPEITKIIKYLIDHYGIKFIVTGSSSFYLKNLFPESLSGRKFLFELHTMSFLEFLYFKDQSNLKQAGNTSLDDILEQAQNKIVSIKYSAYYDEYLKWGGFPEVVTSEDNETKSMVLRNIFASFFEKDLKILSDYKDIRDLRDLMLLLVPRVGTMLDVSRLASELKIDRVKVYGYLEFLQGVFIIKLLPKYSKSIDRSVAGGKKVIFTDNGLLRALGEVNDGQLFENSIANQLSHYGELMFYNMRNKEEIDFILNKKHAFEIKLVGDENDVVRLKRIIEKLGLEDGYVVSKRPVQKKGIISPVF